MEVSECSVRRSETCAAGGENRVAVSYGKLRDGYWPPVASACYEFQTEGRGMIESKGDQD